MIPVRTGDDAGERRGILPKPSVEPSCAPNAIAHNSVMRQFAAVFGSIFVGVALATTATVANACPQQPEPAALTSAAFRVNASGEALLFSAAPSFQSVRFALRIVRPAGARVSSATFVRLKRRADCNVLDHAGQWDFDLSAPETERLFAAASELERLGDDPADLVLDGTSVELQRYSSGERAFTYASNGRAKEQLSRAVLEVLKSHVPNKDLPATSNWQFRLPGSSL